MSKKKPLSKQPNERKTGIGRGRGDDGDSKKDIDKSTKLWEYTEREKKATKKLLARYIWSAAENRDRTALRSKTVTKESDGR